MQEVFAPGMLGVARALIKKNLEQTNYQGAPLFTVPFPDALGIPRRADSKEQLTVAQIYDSIYKEGQHMGAIDSIQFGKGVTAEVFSTIAAASHTIFAVPYENASKKWKKTLINTGYTPPENTMLVEGNENGHARYIPTQLITWVMLKVKTGDGPNDYTMAPIDLYQIARAQQEDPHQITLPGLDPNKPDESMTLDISEDVFTQIFGSVEKHVSMHTRYLRDLYNQDVLAEINQRLGTHGIQLSEKSDTDIANTMALGYFRDRMKKTGLGGGPQSVQTTHIHTTAHLDLDELRKRIAEKVLPVPDERREQDLHQIQKVTLKQREELVFVMAQVLKDEPDISSDALIEKIQAVTQIQDITAWLRTHGGWIGDLAQDNEAVRLALYLRAKEAAKTVKIVEDVFGKGGKAPLLGTLQFLDPKKFSPELIFKQIDPYSTIFKRLMDPWVQDRLLQAFQNLGVSTGQIESFEHHVEPHRLDVRVSEGWTIEVRNNKGFAEVQTALNTFLDTMSNLWIAVHDAWKVWCTSGNDNTLILLQSHPFNLTPEAVNVIKQIIPSNRQLRAWVSDTTLSAEDQERFRRTLERRNSPERLERARRRILEGDLADRALVFGLYQVLGGKVYEQTKDNGETEKVEFDKGYNIPGVPGFGITYEKSVDGWTIRICPLLSEKAMAETYEGAPIVRETGAAGT